jgi:hypothetical protein
MRYLTQTITILVVFCLTTSSSAMLESPEGKVQTFTISGNAGISGVAMIGLPGDPVTDEHGLYCTEVEYGWNGTVTPTKEGYLFEPASRQYTDVTSDQANDNYKPKIIRYTISGQVGAPFIVMQGLPGSPVLPGVLMQGLPGNPVTDENGYYTSTVDYGWAGTVKPVKEGYTFNPPEMRYTKVMRDQKKQNYTTDQPSQVWQFNDGRWEPIMGAAVDRRGSRRVTRTTGFRPIDSRKVLMVPSAQVNPKNLAEIIEDMQVMSHILDERFKETRRIQGVFTDFGDFFGRDNRQTEAIYLQGYGVLFSMEVNFAFSTSPRPQPMQTAEPNEQVDSTWLKAKQQVFSPGGSRGPDGPDSAEEYNSQMVEELKRDLITTLKHAANIRGAKPNEWIILTVIGSGRLAGGFGGGGFMMGGMGGYGGGMGGGYSSSYGVSGGSSGYIGGMGGGMGGGMVGGMGGGMGGFSDMKVYNETGVAPATVLTIRAKKSDIDAFAKGELDYEQFRQKVQIFTY